jgi:hypothetical protein
LRSPEALRKGFLYFVSVKNFIFKRSGYFELLRLKSDNEILVGMKSYR